jgi:hypothetical protein
MEKSLQPHSPEPERPLGIEGELVIGEVTGDDGLVVIVNGVLDEEAAIK